MHRHRRRLHSIARQSRIEGAEDENRSREKRHDDENGAAAQERFHEPRHGSRAGVKDAFVLSPREQHVRLVKQVKQRLVSKPHEKIETRVAHEPIQQRADFKEKRNRRRRVEQKPPDGCVSETHDENFELISLPESLSELHRAHDELKEDRGGEHSEMDVVSRGHVRSRIRQRNE